METPLNNQNQQFSISDLCNDFELHCKKNKEHFVVNKQNESVIKILVLYFAEHESSKLNPNKGIYLCGSVGTGKTTLMRMFASWPHNKRKYLFASCRDIQQEFAIGGFQSLLKYSKKSFKYRNGNHMPQNGWIAYCFDDFGSEGKAMYFGNKVLVMEEIVQDRYNQYEVHGMLTHATSNLISGEVIQEMYGIRVRDRIRGMFNIIELSGDTFRI